MRPFRYSSYIACRLASDSVPVLDYGIDRVNLCFAVKRFQAVYTAYLLITIFAASPVFLSANTDVKLDWIHFHPFYHIYMGLKNAYFGTPADNPLYYMGCLAVKDAFILLAHCIIWFLLYLSISKWQKKHT